MSISILINGQPVQADAEVTITNLLRKKGIDPSHVVVEINRSIIDRQLFDSTTISTGDTLEILRFVGGG